MHAEGQACGLIKNLALMCEITVGTSHIPIIEFLNEWGVEPLERVDISHASKTCKVFVNGAWIGVHHDPGKLVQTLRQLRRAADIDKDVAVVHDVILGEIRIFTDCGRCMRPLYVVENHTLKMRAGTISCGEDIWNTSTSMRNRRR
jgi:DNA-directed RNA polymerase II subunit RPB2